MKGRPIVSSKLTKFPSRSSLGLPGPTVLVVSSLSNICRSTCRVVGAFWVTFRSRTMRVFLTKTFMVAHRRLCRGLALPRVVVADRASPVRLSREFKLRLRQFRVVVTVQPTGLFGLEVTVRLVNRPVVAQPFLQKSVSKAVLAVLLTLRGPAD